MTARRLSPAAMLGLAVGIPLIIFAIEWVFAKQLATAYSLPISGLAMAVALVFACLHWRRLDEAGRTAHRFAWFWGSTWALMALSIAACVVLAIPTLRQAANQGITDYFGRIDAEAHSRFGVPLLAFLAGLFLTGILQAVGHLAAWLFWWAGRRGQ
jgi:hypothetical protein